MTSFGRRSRALRAACMRAAFVRAMLVLTALVPVAASTPATAQELSVERIYGSEDLRARLYPVQWMPEPGRFARLVPNDSGVPEVWAVEAVSGDSVKLIAATELVPAGASEPIQIASVQFSSDGRRVLLFADAERVWRSRTRGAYYAFDVPTRRLIPIGSEPGDQMFAKFSPDGGRVAYVREGDLFVFDIDAGTERQLTTDGGGPIVNGTSDWLYEEELGLRDAFRWSPDGSRIALWRFDKSPVTVYELYDMSTLYPTTTPIRYPKAGTSNSAVRVGTIELASGEITWFDIEGGDDAYIPWMEWAASPDEVLIQRLNRAQNRLDVYLGVAATGETRLLFSEVSDTWLSAVRDVYWLRGGQEFVWTSDRDGYRHIYVYDRGGRLQRQVTRGQWTVTSIAGVDTTASVVYFTSTVESPMTRAIQAADLDGSGEVHVLVGGRGVRRASFGPDFAYFIETASTTSEPPVVTLRDRTGAVARVLEDNAELKARLAALDLRAPEFIDLRAADGTPLNGWIMKPRDFDPSRAYPLLLYTYGGPGSQTVLDAWGGRRYLWHQMLVRRGMLVASVDNRGTAGRGRDFAHQTYLKLGQLEAADQLAAASQLGALRYVDEEHIGIWGWSYGGYVSLMTTLLSDGAISAAVAVAPVTHWKFYDTAFTERFMSTPAQNPEGYRLGAPVNLAERLQSDLLLVHGTGDDNVHLQNTMRMADALIEAGRPFDMALYPNRRHGIAGGSTRVHLFRRITTYLLDHLVAEPLPEPGRPMRLGAGPFIGE